MKHSEFDTAYKSYNDTLDVKNINDSRKPQVFLKDLNKLRKMRELRRYDELKRKEFLPIMYGSPEEGGF